MVENITVFTQSSIKIESGSKVYYFDPFGITEELHDADYIFITHDHYDHLSPEDISKVMKDSTAFFAPENTAGKLKGIAADARKVYPVKPGAFYEKEDVEFDTIPAYNNLKPLLGKEIPICKEEENFKNVLSIVKTTNEKYNEYEEEMYNEIIMNINDLIEKMKNEKKFYEGYLKALSIYKEEKRKMEKYKNTYHSSAQIAEKATLYLKELVIKKKLNNDPLINQQIEISDNESKNRLTIMSKDCSVYVTSLENVNILRTKLNIRQKNLLKMYEDLEKDDKNLYSKIMEIIRKYQKKILDYTGDSLNMTVGIQKNIDIDRDVRELVESLRSREKPEKEIPYIHYPTEMDFDKCNDNKDYRVVNEVVKTMKKYSKKVFMNYDEKLEEKKNKMRDLLYKFFDLNRQADMDDRKQLLEYLNDERTHELFLIILSKLRTNNRFCRDKQLIELLSEILCLILDSAEKKNDFYAAKNCIILSQTFYCNDDSQANKKIYILDYLKKHKWLKSMGFWKDFILTMILKEFKKLDDMNTDDKINISKNKNIPDNVKPKIGEVLFSQLLPYVGNMTEINLEKKYIIKIIDDINDRYNYMCQSNIEAIYDLVCKSKEELKEVKEQIKNDKELTGSSLNETLIKNSTKKGDDEDEDEEEESNNNIIN